MRLLRYFTPDRMEKDIYCYTAEFFVENGIKYAVFDLDNTIAPYSVTKPSQKVKDYFKGLQEAGITVSIVSNNGEERVTAFNEELGLFCVSNAKKPNPGGVLRCLAKGQKDSFLNNSCLVGDQLFTDCVAARRAGIACFLVEPIQPRENLFFKLKRLLERPFIWRYKRITKRSAP